MEEIAVCVRNAETASEVWVTVEGGQDVEKLYEETARLVQRDALHITLSSSPRSAVPRTGVRVSDTALRDGTLLLLLASDAGAAAAELLRRSLPLTTKGFEAAAGREGTDSDVRLYTAAAVPVGDALHAAAAAGRAEAVFVILAGGAVHPDTRNDRRATALHTAAYRGHCGPAQVLLQHGAEVEAEQIDGETPLYLAAAKGHVECLRLLLEAGASPTRPQALGRTPVHAAAAGGHAGVLRELLAVAGDGEAAVPLPPPLSGTALHAAAASGVVEAVQVLLPLRVPQVPHGANTPLHEAASCGRTEVTALLLQHDASCVAAVGRGGKTPLHVAAVRGHTEVLRLLMAADGGRVVCTHRDGKGRTPLHAAVDANSPECVAILWTGEGDAEALYLGAQHGRNLATAELLRLGADPNTIISGKLPPLHVAAQGGHTDVLRVLLEGGALPDTTVKGHTALFFAVYHGHPKAVEVLLASGAKVTSNTSPALAFSLGHPVIGALLWSFHDNSSNRPSRPVGERKTKKRCKHRGVPAANAVRASGCACS